jgi:acetyl-CoA carboxylase biotin carboxyl carrier protein
MQAVNPQPVPASDVEEEADAGPGGGDNLVAITSPMVGTFYRAPSEGAEPYVTVGSFVEPDTVVCIVEAMKVMNEVKADVAGEIVEILVQNGEPVEYGQELFMVKPAGGGD